MKCPFCSYEDTKVIDSRSIDRKKRRRRECTNCQRRFTTYETIDVPALAVEKRDGSFEPFDKNKLVNGIYSAIKKRPVSAEAVSRIADETETCFLNDFRETVSSSEIGNIVLEKLKKLDVIAYIRFASVYKDFTDLESFIGIISELDTK